MWWCLAAVASPTNGDFEQGLDGWNDASNNPGEASAVVQGDDFSALGGADSSGLVFPSPTQALLLRGGPANALQYGAIESEPFLIVHESLTAQAYNESPLTVGQMNLFVDGSNRAQAVLDAVSGTWFTVGLDASAVCGSRGSIRFVQTADVERGFTLFDDVVGDTVCALYLDQDGDGECPLGVDLDDDGTCIQAGEGVALDEGAFDCDDFDAGRFAGNPEVPDDGIDQDCDGDDVTQGCFEDLDNDGFGTVNVLGPVGCIGPNVASVGGDCNDLDALAYPGQLEACDGRDTDCDGNGDGPEVEGFLDSDGDGYGAESVHVCGFNVLAVADGGDCDDHDPDRNPGATETVSDGVDQDCDGFELCYVDLDMDGHGTTATTTGPLSCDRPPDDCDDTDFTVHPQASELCDGKDNDCDVAIDEGLPQFPFFLDVDGDGYGGDTTQACSGPGPDWIQVGGDCDEGDPTVHPGADEQPFDGVDQDCDGGELCFTDNDGDGFGTPILRDSLDLDCDDPGESENDDDCNDLRANVYPGAPEEVGNDVDEDCDGVASQLGDGSDEGRILYRGGALCRTGFTPSFRSLTSFLRR